MCVFSSFKLAASPWHTSGHNSRIFPRLLRHLAALFGFIYPAAFQYSDIFIFLLLFQYSHWSAYVIINHTASRTHQKILLTLFWHLRHFIYFYITAFVFKLRNYLENKERLLPLHLPLRIHCGCVPLVHCDIDFDLQLRSAQFCFASAPLIVPLFVNLALIQFGSAFVPSSLGRTQIGHC